MRKDAGAKNRTVGEESTLHDENVIRSPRGNIFVIDCDIGINIPELRCGGIRTLTTEIEFK